MTTNLFDSQQALAFLVSQQAHIETEVYKTQYPDYDYAALIPVDTSANEWSKVVTFFSLDMVGKARWQSGSALDVPVADVERDRGDKTLHMAAIGYEYNLEEINTARLVPGTNLTADKADAARLAYAQFMYALAFTGNAEKGMEGLTSYTGVTAVNSPGNGTGSSTYWAAKTALQIIKDFNDLLAGVFIGSKTVEMADTVLLPVGVFLYLSSTPMSADNSETILSYLLRNNIYTATTGQQLTIRMQRELDTAAAGATGRVVAYKRDPKVLKLHLPMPHRFLPVWQNGPFNFLVPGIFRTGGLEIRRPGAVRYMDLVSATPA